MAFNPQNLKLFPTISKLWPTQSP